MIIELPGVDFENSYPNAMAIEPLFVKFDSFLIQGESIGMNTSLEANFTAGFVKLVIQKTNYFWLVCTTEHGSNFDVAIFSNKFHAINYFIFRLTGEKDMIVRN